ncbi:MAG: hypothetical protein ACFFAE_16695 [Candidatus Hodarchaeota archaeon]
MNQRLDIVVHPVGTKISFGTNIIQTVELNTPVRRVAKKMFPGTNIVFSVEQKS